MRRKLIQASLRLEAINRESAREDCISIVLEVSQERSEGFGEAIARTVRENGRAPGFDLSEFEDVEW